VRLWSERYRQHSSFELDNITRDEAASWSNYIRGVAFALQEAGLVLRGMDAVVVGDVPIGSGLSSSAALEVATAVSFLALAGLCMAPEQVAQLCQRAENEFVGVNSGIMDQLVSALGQAGRALLIDCRTLEYSAVPVPRGVSIIVCDTLVRRKLVSSGYNERRRQCEEGVHLLRAVLGDIRALRDVCPQDLVEHGSALPPIVLKRCRHVVGENDRVLKMATALRDGDLATVTACMAASHASLREDYEVSCRELDVMVEAARSAPGCIGARLTGAGFGGCTVNLVDTAASDRFVRHVSRAYEAAMGAIPNIYVCHASDGAAEAG